MKTIYANKPRAINYDLKKNEVYCTNCSSTEEPQEELNMKTKVECNLQNHNFTHQKSNIKEEEETYIIPSIING